VPSRDSADRYNCGYRSCVPLCNRRCGTLEPRRHRKKKGGRGFGAHSSSITGSSPPRSRSCSAVKARGRAGRGNRFDVLGGDALQHAAGDSYEVILLDATAQDHGGRRLPRPHRARVGCWSPVLMLWYRPPADTSRNRVDGLWPRRRPITCRSRSPSPNCSRGSAPLSRRTTTGHSPRYWLAPTSCSHPCDASQPGAAAGFAQPKEARRARVGWLVGRRAPVTTRPSSLEAGTNTSTPTAARQVTTAGCGASLGDPPLIDSPHTVYPSPITAAPSAA